MIRIKKGLYKEKGRISVDIKKENRNNSEEKEDGRLLAKVDPLADITSMRAV